ncbi:MAG: MarR family transcriptional regulator [Hyphomonadaceae bacterium]|nr:MAG: MarR family transcriptional regulator [Caulobacteraceae bacterium]MBT9447208.1 MarR family transcriptional regulator [Hyphomonadaceae bacterium]TPW08232.1 MAG: MarR family transcriptional regulator [Alphaproteobacteria bacterium]
MKEGCDLETLLGYQMQKCHLLLTSNARAVLDGFGISPAKLAALLLIRENPGCDQTSLGRMLSVNRSSAMKLVDRLEELGLVDRRQGRDMRSNGLFLTDHAELIVGDMLNHVRAAERSITESLTAREGADLLRLLLKLQFGQVCAKT